MASEEDHDHDHDHHVFPDDDLDDDDEDSEPLNGAVPPDDDATVDSDSSSDADIPAVTVAIPSSVSATPTSAVTVALPDPKRQKPIDDNRRLFQRLWTDEDEIELLQGFLDYTTSRGMTSSGHHHDTAAFYDQIKSKLQLEFNKNQLVEKLRRLKKKYRNVLSKMSSGKEFCFKSPHDQATFEISRKIWSNLSANHRGPVEFDDDDQNPNPTLSIAAVTPPPSSGGGGSGGYMISHINLNNAASSDQKPSFVLSSSPAIAAASAAAKLSSRKRPRVEDKYVRVNLGPPGSENVNTNNIYHNVVSNNSSNINNNMNSNVSSSNVNIGPAMQGLIEETVRNCLSPVFKELINNAVNEAGLVVGGVNGGGGGGASVPTTGGGGGFKGVSQLALNAVPLSFSGVNSGTNGGEMMDEKWRKQQILELEVYSKRLELVQDQIKLTLEELRSMGG